MCEYDVNHDASDKYSLRGRVFRKLREAILNGSYQEKDELKEAAIAEELGVSRTPVREAFRQLELEGLIQIVPNKGARDGRRRKSQRKKSRRWRRLFC